MHPTTTFADTSPPSGAEVAAETASKHRADAAADDSPNVVYPHADALESLRSAIAVDAPDSHDYLRRVDVGHAGE